MERDTFLEYFCKKHNSVIMDLLSKLFCAAVSLAALSCSRPQPSADIIPMPGHCRFDGRICDVGKLVGISAGGTLENECMLLKDMLSGFGMEKEIIDHGGDIRIAVDHSMEVSEAYRLKVTPDGITVHGGSPAGVFYGIVSLAQEINAGGVKCGMIEDAPRFGWRGVMLDEARHFFGEEKVMQILDLMAYYKLNKFHWHLTDAQGWRIEIRKYPRLTEIGGIGNHTDRNAPAKFYTREQIRRIVEYAEKRHIEIIPEIDMPGHASAAVRAYPQFNGGGSAENPDFTFNVGKEGTYAFLSDIIGEVADLFPGKHVHIGGDEVAFGSEAWKTDPYIRGMILREHLDGIKGAEGFFMNRMIDSVRTAGKEVFGWDDMMEYGVDPEKCRIMWWRHDRPELLRKAVADGFDVVMCPRRPLYLDFIQHGAHRYGRVWNGFCPLEDIYAFPDSLQAFTECAGPGNVLGIQANVWTETMQDTRRLDFMMFPRVCALAESAWTSPDNKDYGSFCRRMAFSYSLFDALGIYCFDPEDPDRHAEPAGPDGQQ